jgi:TusA-related sulfurtransferase
MMRADEELDLLGLLCPEPLFRTKYAVDQMEKGKVLKVLADDPGAEEDLKRWADRTGNELVAIEREGARLVFYLKK